MKFKIGYALVVMVFMSCKSKPSKSVEKVDENEEWTVLFDGTNFDNWRGYLKDEMPSSWSIEDGAMAFVPSKDSKGNIITKSKYTNFILSLEWKISKGGNSGIFWGIHEDKMLKEPYMTGPEIQVLDNEGHPDAKRNPKYHQAGALYDMVQPKHDVCKPAGAWNLYEIKIDYKENQGVVTLNGTVVSEFPLYGDLWDEMVANSKFKDWEHFGKYHTGYIGLQDHNDKVWYRNIKIKEL